MPVIADVSSNFVGGEHRPDVLAEVLGCDLVDGLRERSRRSAGGLEQR